jgi:hypothetical protein
MYVLRPVIKHLHAILQIINALYVVLQKLLQIAVIAINRAIKPKYKLKLKNIVDVKAI